MTLLSVVIPTWREASGIAQAVRAAARIGDEVIVADADSPDDTARIAQEAGARVVRSAKGRGAQLRAGAEAAHGDTLLFLHADAGLPATARAAIERVLRDPACAGGNFYLRFTPQTPAARFYTFANHARRQWLNVYYGDSALFLRRNVYDELGGFRALPIFEDYELIRRLERSSKTAYVRDVEIEVSARRFAEAPLRTLLLWSTIHSLYWLGVPAEKLAHLYHDLRAEDAPGARPKGSL